MSDVSDSKMLDDFSVSVIGCLTMSDVSDLIMWIRCIAYVIWYHKMSDVSDYWPSQTVRFIANSVIPDFRPGERYERITKYAVKI